MAPCLLLLKMKYKLLTFVLVGMLCISFVMAATVTLRPDSAGDKAELTADPAVANYLNVDEEVADDGTTQNYYTSTGFNKEDLYNLEDTGASGVINSVKVYSRVYTAAGGAGSAGSSGNTLIKVDGTEYDGDLVGGAWSWVTLSTTYTTNPDTSLAWTWDEIDSLQAGVHLEGGGETANTGILTQVYVEVDYTETHNVYQEDGNYSSTSDNTNDGEWDTGVGIPVSQQSYYVNYTKPDDALISSLWLVKDAGDTVNLTIPDACWNYNATGLSFKYKWNFAAITWDCKNDTAWHNLRANSDVVIYEEAMWWNIEGAGAGAGAPAVSQTTFLKDGHIKIGGTGNHFILT